MTVHFQRHKNKHIITFAIKSSICTKTQKTNFKIFTRWYLTPTLHRCFPTASDLCWRCGEDKGSLFTYLLVLPKTKELLWDDVCIITQKFTEYKIPADAFFFLLHLSKISAKTYKKSLLQHLLNAAKARIPLYWKQ